MGSQLGIAEKYVHHIFDIIKKTGKQKKITKGEEDIVKKLIASHGEVVQDVTKLMTNIAIKLIDAGADVNKQKEIVIPIPITQQTDGQ